MLLDLQRPMGSVRPTSNVTMVRDSVFTADLAVMTEDWEWMIDVVLPLNGAPSVCAGGCARAVAVGGSAVLLVI